MIVRGVWERIAIFALVAVIGYGADAAVQCKHGPADCTSPDCEKTYECDYGRCDVDQGGCLCDPCFDGPACSDYVNKYPPYFSKDVELTFAADYTGYVYQAVVIDKDLSITCPKSVAGSSTEACPCGVSVFSLQSANPAHSDTFTIDPLTGVVLASQALVLGNSYVVEITAIDTKGDAEASMNLTVTVADWDNKKPKEKPKVKRSVKSHFSHDDGEEEEEEEEGFYNPKPLPDDLVAQSQNTSNDAVTRKKRATPGTTTADATMTMEIADGAAEPIELYPGQTVIYDIKIVVPGLVTAMDLMAEIFVMDAVSGITPFAICSAEITTIGGSITDENGVALDMAALNSAIELKKNTALPDITDRVIINFGNVANTETDTVGTDYTLSTIVIRFGATLIKNAAYTDTTGYITVGAEYDAQNFIWVSQASYTLDMNPSFTFPSDIVITGASDAKKYGAATFSLTAKITDPSGPLILEVYTPTEDHNKFTVAGLSVDDIGVNMKCTGEPQVSYEYFYSINNRTAHRAQAKFEFAMVNLVYPNLYTKLTDDGNKVEMSFTVFFTEVDVGEVINVAAGVFIGSTTLFTAIADVTILAEDPPATAAMTSYTAVPIGGQTMAQYSTLTWGVEILVPSASGGEVSCTVPVVADYVVSIAWGRAGQNIALRPPLSDEGVVTFDEATKSVTAFVFNLNSTGTVSGDVANTAVLEVSVTFNTAAPADVVVSCGGSSVTLTGATAGTAGTSDMSGTAETVTTDANWYQGSQQALLAVLTFPGGGTPYGTLEMESNGDFDITAFGAEVCSIMIMKAGRGVPTIAGRMENLNKEAVYKQSDPATSKYNDAATISTGAISGVSRGTNVDLGDDQVVVRVVYHTPKNETVTNDAVYNLSLGIVFDAALIWTGWVALTMKTVVAAAPTIAPIFELIPPSTPVELVPGVPTMFKVKMKMAPGTVDEYKIVAWVADTTVISICRIIIIDVGSSYPCLDKNPYGKDLIHDGQITTIIHDTTDWGLKATLDLGVLKNVGYQEYYADGIADSDSIIVGVLVKGVAAGVDVVLNVDVLPTFRTASVQNYDPKITVAGLLTPTGTVTAAAFIATDVDNPTEAFDGVMKLVDLVISFPVPYVQSIVVEVTNSDPASAKLCFAAVAIVGTNLPCVIAHTVVVVPELTDVLEKYTLNVLDVCQYEVIPGSLDDNKLTIRVGVQGTKDSTGGTISAVILEGGTATAVTAADYVFTMSSTAFDDTSLVTITDGFAVELTDTTNTIVHPGLSMFYEIKINLPPGTMGKIEIGAMAPTSGGRALATLHSFRWTDVIGKNIGCQMAEDQYDVQLIQNSSLIDPMIHESQTDTLVVDLGYMTNTGISYLQQFPTEPDDNTFGLELEIMMADHPDAITAYVVPISIAVKFADVIYVVTKNLEMLRDTALDLMVVRTEMIFSDLAVPPPTYDPGDQIPMTFRIYHDMNVSRQEGNDARIRFLLPRPVKFVAATDIETCNITTYVFTEQHYLDFEITNFFFTDFLEINVTVTVDPDNDMIKGLGLIDAAALARLVCTTVTDATTPRYCGTSTVLSFKINGAECFDDLGIAAFIPCQFSASTAIDTGTGPDKSASTGWSPAVRSGPGWNHYITIDFLKKTRVTRIVFTDVAGTKPVTTFRLEKSSDGLAFSKPCGNTDISVPAGGIVNLVDECKFEARYGRLLIVAGSPYDQAFGVNFQWFGCAIDSIDDTCNPLTTIFTDAPGWRQIADDATNGIFYFCDHNPLKKKNVCFSTADGATWNAMPGYIGSLVGLVGDIFYARDQKNTATISSIDGVHWLVVDATTAAGLTVTAQDVPGQADASFTTVTDGDYSADFTGIQKDGAYIAKWESCCS